MAGPYLKQWRKKRGMTLEQAAARLEYLDDPGVPTTAASLSRLENGKQGYTQRSIEALANIYECEVHELVSVDPLHRDALDEMFSAMRGKSEHERARIARLLQAITAAEESAQAVNGEA